MFWLMKRLFSTRMIGYLIEKVKPMLQEEMLEMSKEAIDDLLSDEEFLNRLTMVGDAYYQRYSKKLWGTIGGLQKGINATGQQSGGLPIPDIFNDEGQLNLSQAFKFLMSGGLKRMQLGGNQAQNSPRTQEGVQNAPEM